MDRRLLLKIFGLGAVYPLWGCATPCTSPEIKVTAYAEPQSNDTPYDDAPDWPKIALVACGGAGIEMTRAIDKAKFGLHEIIAIDTSGRALRSATHADKTLLIRSNKGQKPDSADSAWRWAAEQHGNIREIIGNPHMVIIVTGLGGSAGTGIANIVDQIALGSGAFTVAFAGLPFAFEDDERQANGRGGFHALSLNTDNSLALPNDLLLASLGPDATVSEVLQESSTALAHYLWNVCGCITRAGLVGIDFEDVRTALDFRDENCTSAIGWGEAGGSERGRFAAKRALAHPLLLTTNQGQIRGVSVSIRARSGSLKMLEVNLVMNEVKTIVPDDAHVIFSADYDDSLGDLMQVSIIINRQRWLGHWQRE